MVSSTTGQLEHNRQVYEAILAILQENGHKIFRQEGSYTLIDEKCIIDLNNDHGVELCQIRETVPGFGGLFGPTIGGPTFFALNNPNVWQEIDAYLAGL